MYLVFVHRLRCVPCGGPFRPLAGVAPCLPRCNALRSVAQRAPPFQTTSADGRQLMHTQRFLVFIRVPCSFQTTSANGH